MLGQTNNSNQNNSTQDTTSTTRYRKIPVTDNEFCYLSFTVDDNCVVNQIDNYLVEPASDQYMNCCLYRLFSSFVIQ